MAELARRAADLRDSSVLTLEDLERLLARIVEGRERLEGSPDGLSLYGAGALLHGYYTHLERFFERVARDLDGAAPEGPDWHRRLLRSMTLDRPGLRPPLLTRELSDRLDVLLRFRHVFRNLYVLDLDPKQVLDLMEAMAGLHGDIRAALQGFVQFLGRVAAEDA